MYRLFLFLFAFAVWAYPLSCFIPQYDIDTISDGVVWLTYKLPATGNARIITRQMLLDSINHLRDEYTTISVARVDSVVPSTVFKFADENGDSVSIEVFGSQPDTIRYDSFLLLKGGCPGWPGVVFFGQPPVYCVYDTRPVICPPSIGCARAGSYALVIEKQHIYLTVTDGLGMRAQGARIAVEYIDADQTGWFYKDYSAVAGSEFLVFADGLSGNDVLLNFGPRYGCQFSIWGFQAIDGRIIHESFPGVSVAVDDLKKGLAARPVLGQMQKALYSKAKPSSYSLDGRRTSGRQSGVYLLEKAGRIYPKVRLR